MRRRSQIGAAAGRWADHGSRLRRGARLRARRAPPRRGSTPPRQRQQPPAKRRGRRATGPRRGCAARRRSTRPAPIPRHRDDQLRPRRRTRPSPPSSVNGRLFVRQGRQRGYCSATAIDSPSRQLVLTAGHCVNSGPTRAARRQRLVALPRVRPRLHRRRRRPSASSSPIARTSSRPSQWVKTAQPQLRLRRARHRPPTPKARQRRRRGRRRRHDRHRPQPPARTSRPSATRARAAGCRAANRPTSATTASPTAIPGPPTMAIRCHWAPGRQRRRLADRRRDRDQRPDQLRQATRQRPHLRPLLQPAQRRPPRRRPLGLGRRLQQVAVEAVVAPLRPQVRGERQVVARALRLARSSPAPGRGRSARSR